MTMFAENQFAQTLLAWRKTNRLSQAEAAKKISISREYLGKIERGLVVPGNALRTQITHLITTFPNKLFSTDSSKRQTVRFITAAGKCEVSGYDLTVRLPDASGPVARFDLRTEAEAGK